MSWIQTFKGKKLDVQYPNKLEVCIEDIAHSLSLICRFGGHCREFYSVAEHSIRVADKAPKELRLKALLHDAAETYLLDIPRPIKPLLNPLYSNLTARVENVIYDRFKISRDTNHAKIIKEIDGRMLMTEARDLMGVKEGEWVDMGEPYPEEIVPMSSKTAELIFLQMFEEYRNKD